MSSEKHAAARSGHVCPSCGRAMPTSVERHKSMGVYVPVYTEGPCDNSDCSRSRSAKAARTVKTGEPEGERAEKRGS
ncbi:hypothetical protein [Streptomyces sp. NPDC003023]|uniref:hypothetical protein n=1 Tax=Streptomyces sp. NPDC003023 TaxID=3364675 RepID=UPI0036D0FC99